MLESLQQLEKLGLGSNRLATLPPGVFTLPSLRELDLSNNELLALPTDVEQLHSLEVRGQEHTLIMKPAGKDWRPPASAFNLVVKQSRDHEDYR